MFSIRSSFLLMLSIKVHFHDMHGHCKNKDNFYLDLVNYLSMLLYTAILNTVGNYTNTGDQGFRLWAFAEHKDALRHVYLAISIKVI